MSNAVIAAILVGCVALVGALYAVYKRGLLGGGKVEEQAPAGSAKS